MNWPSKPQKTASFHHELARLNTRWHLDRVLLEESRRLKFLCSELKEGNNDGNVIYFNPEDKDPFAKVEKMVREGLELVDDTESARWVVETIHRIARSSAGWVNKSGFAYQISPLCGFDIEGRLYEQWVKLY